MADFVDPRMTSVKPRIRYNTIGGINGPLVFLDNVRQPALLRRCSQQRISLYTNSQLTRIPFRSNSPVTMKSCPSLSPMEPSGRVRSSKLAVCPSIACDSGFVQIANIISLVQETGRSFRYELHSSYGVLLIWLIVRSVNIGCDHTRSSKELRVSMSRRYLFRNSGHLWIRQLTLPDES